MFVDPRQCAILMVITALLSALVTGLAVHWVDRNHYTAVVATLEATHATKLKAIADKAAEQAIQATRQKDLWDTTLQALDTKRTEELNHAKAENDRLRADVAAGTVRLRIAVAQARARSSSMPEAAGPTSVDHATVDLAPEARQAYFDLRDALTEDAKKIAALQDYVRGVCLKPG